MFKDINSKETVLEREQKVLAFWEENKIFEKSLDQNKDAPMFTFYDGPPTANGKPHIGHVLTRVIKDITPRYKTMKGYLVLRKAGWDCHGLPVELEVEKELKIDGKKQIEAYGIEPFITKCKTSVWKYKDEWEQISKRVGYWIDTDHPYITYTNDYIESVWWSLKTLYEKGLLYKGHKILPYCPRCGTTLSSHEVDDGYKEVEERTVIAKFPVVGREKTYFLAWTTTPWTLPSNVALCVNAAYDYAECYIPEKDESYIVAAELAKSLFTEGGYEIKSVKKGKEYEHTKYSPLFNYVYDKYEASAWYVVCDDYVKLEEGTGIVHIAPAFGQDDANVGRKYGLPTVILVDEEGKLTKECGEFAGVFVKTADAGIISYLKHNNLFFSELRVKHKYPFCWRCDTPLLYYPRDTWFVKTTAVKKEIIANNNGVNWFPATIKTGRMGNFLEDLIDWGLSRDRYWGTPLPVWVCNKCGKVEVIGSIAELMKKGGLTEEIELHKPYVDAVKWKCDCCDGTMVRTNEVIDCWYDSGSMPFAQYHYPFENKEMFEKTFPAAFIAEGSDQTRGWFYSLLALSTTLFGRSAYDNCIAIGLVCDQNGKKMSKHIGNVVNPWSMFDMYGADAVRWYFCVNCAPWLPSRFFPEKLKQEYGKFIGTLWNTYAFFVLYANIDKFNPADYTLEECKLSLMDKWLLSRFNDVLADVEDCIQKYNSTDAARSIRDFTDELSNWYVRRGRDRYWKDGVTEDKKAAFMTLYTVLEKTTRMIAPFVPFVAESIYQNLVRTINPDAPISVHLTRYPECDSRYLDRELEHKMAAVIRIVEAGRAARESKSIKIRQPLPGLTVSLSDKLNVELDEEMLDIIRGELNVKAVTLAPVDESIVKLVVKPQLKTLGPKYQSAIGAIQRYLASADTAKLMKEINEAGSHCTTLNGQVIVFTADDVMVSAVSASARYEVQYTPLMTLVLDCEISEELKIEGFAREIISKVQNKRKEVDGLCIEDKINVRYSAQGYCKKAFELRRDLIASNILAESMTEDDTLTETIDINDETAKIAIVKA